MELEYGESFEIWVGERYANYYTNYGFGQLFVAEEGFNGITRQKNGDEYDAIGVQFVDILSAEIEQGNYVYQDNMYKYVMKKVDKDLNLYFDTMLLRKQTYLVKYTSSDVCQISSPYSVAANEKWTFSITAGEEGVDYSNMKVYINGEKINKYDSESGSNVLKYEVNKPTPSSYNIGVNTNFSEYVITIEDIDLLQKDYTKVKLQPNEHIFFVNYSAQGESMPFYFDTQGYYYYLKDVVNIEVSFGKNSIYNYENMEIQVNSVVTEYNFDGQSFVINFTPDYQDEYYIVVTGIVKAKFEYKIKNDYAANVNLYININNVKTLITDEITLILEAGDTFELIFECKEEGQDVSGYIFTGVDDTVFDGGFNIDLKPTDTKGISIRVNADSDQTGREINVAME